MAQVTSIGVDGCKAGWFYVLLESTGFAIGVAKAFIEIVDLTSDNAAVMVDIPIGLRDTSDIGRQCDMEARRLLRAPRASSVFSAPIRPILFEPSYEQANRKSRRVGGKGISRQAFAIIPKIREVDELLLENEKARRLVREIHPEVCFWALNCGRAMRANKKKKEGFEERMAVLRRLLPMADDVVAHARTEYGRKEVAKDDVVDALAALVTARGRPEEIRTIPETPELDSRGLPMEMVYRSAGDS